MYTTSPICSCRWFLLGAGMVMGLTGCVAPYQSEADRSTQQREDQLLMMQEVRKLEGRLEGLEMELQAMDRTVDGVSRSATQGARAEGESLRASITSLEKRMSSLEAARARDRDEIIDHLTRKITQLMGDRPSGRPSSSVPRGGGSEVGYEHVVQAGENLSRIAAAYGVSSKAIIDANQLSKPDQLKVGQKLFIPQ